MKSKKQKAFDLQVMKNYIKKVYPGKGFAYEVDNEMSPRQVKAIYLSVKEREARKANRTNDEPGKWVQMTLFDKEVCK